MCSNYVYHNVLITDKQELLREMLRCLKRGGTLAIHDLMSPMRNDDMQALCDSLHAEGYANMHAIPLGPRRQAASRSCSPSPQPCSLKRCQGL